MKRRSRHSPADSARRLAALIDSHAARLVLYARQICDEPEDVVQEAFLEFIEQSEPPRQITHWLFRVVRNRALDRARSASRRERKHKEVATRQDWLTPDLDSQLDSEAVTESLKELDPDSREIITARIWGELSFEQIGELTGTSSSTAHRRYVEGLQQLRQKLEAACPEND